MRTNVVIDDALLAEAMQCTGLTTKKAVIDEALRALVRLRRQSDVRRLRGQLRWEGDLAMLREGRFADAYHAEDLAGAPSDNPTEEPGPEPPKDADVDR